MLTQNPAINLNQNITNQKSKFFIIPSTLPGIWCFRNFVLKRQSIFISQENKVCSLVGYNDLIPTHKINADCCILPNSNQINLNWWAITIKQYFKDINIKFSQVSLCLYKPLERVQLEKWKKLPNQGNSRRNEQFADRMRKQYTGHCGNKINGFNLINQASSSFSI